MVNTRWAPTSYKRSYNYNPSYPDIRPFIGVMTLLITSRGPPCTAVFVFFFRVAKICCTRPDRWGRVRAHRGRTPCHHQGQHLGSFAPNQRGKSQRGEKHVASRELTYLFPKALFESMIFRTSRLVGYVIVSWRVAIETPPKKECLSLSGKDDIIFQKL